MIVYVMDKKAYFRDCDPDMCCQKADKAATKGP